MRMITYSISVFLLGGDISTHHIRLSLGWTGIVFERSYLCSHCKDIHWPSSDWLTRTADVDTEA